MKDSPLVSIALLTYNHEKYIKDCLTSILEQSYTNLEVVILDDASNDKTVLFIESYLEILRKKYKNIFFLKNRTNKGNIPHNMNCILRKCNGVYCKMLSGDDILNYNCISKLVECLLNYPQCSVIYSNGFIVHDNYRRKDIIEKTKNLYTYRKSEIESQDLFKKLMFSNHIMAPSVLIKKDILKTYGFLDESISYEDYEYWLRLSSQNVKFYYLNECLVYYRRTVNSLTNFSKGKINRKIKIGMISDRKTLNKYLKYLSKEEQIKCIKFYYYKYLKICWEEKYLLGIIKILWKLKEKNIVFPKDLLAKPSKNQYKENNEKQKKVIKLLERWILNIQYGKSILDYFRENNYKYIGIYGLGCLANRLCEEMRNTEIKIKYIIDRNSDILLSDFKIVTIEEQLENVDVIVITVAEKYDKIKEQLQNKVSCKIIHIEDILYR